MPHHLRRLTGFALLVIAALIGAGMYWRAQQEELWGYAPLFLYLTLYGGVLVLLTYRSGGSWRSNNGLSTLSGMLLGFGFPGLIPVPFLLLVAFVPLWVLHRKLVKENAGYGRVFAHGFSAFLLYNILATYWVTNTGFGAGLFAILANSLLMCLPWLAFHWTSRQSPRVAHLAFAACWISFEYMHYNWPLNWPWLTLGNGFMQWPSLVQWYEVTGVFGGSAWILGCNYLALQLYAAPAAAPRKRRLYALAAVVVLLPIVGSLVRYVSYVPGNIGTIEVAAVQPNFEPHFEKFADNEGAQLDTFARLSKAALAAGQLDYLIFPETSFGWVNEDDPLARVSLQALRKELEPLGLRNLVTGIDAYHVFAPGEPLTPAARPFRGNEMFEYLNAVVQIDLTNGDAQTYRKGVFVPGAESFPFRKVLFFLEDFVNSLGGTVAGRGTQERRLPLTSGTTKIAPVICYESVFGEYFTDYVKEGGQAVFVMTNDGWWDDTGGFRQHLWLSSLRAIETRREVVRSANVGACAFIDQRGKILQKTDYDQAGFLRGTMQLNEGETLYVRWGDIIARIALLLAGMVVLGNLTRSLRNRTAGGKVLK